MGLFDIVSDRRKNYIETLLYRSKELNILHEINRLRGSTHNLTVLLNRLNKLIQQQLQVKNVIALISPLEEKKLEVVSSTEQIIDVEYVHILKKIATDTMLTAFPIIINSTKMHHTLRRFKIKSMLSVPLMVYEGAVGALIVTNKGKGFSKQDVRLLSAIASQTAAAIQFLNLNKELDEKEEEATKLHKLLYEKEKLKAKTDEMTQLYNKRFFLESMTESIEKYQNLSVPFSLVFFDVDFFKLYNDTFGHPAGDKVLKDVAATVKRTVRETDKACRYGGEEFVILLPNTDLEGAQVLAETVRQKLESLYHPSRGDNRVVTASFGVAQYQGEGVEVFINRTDQNLYRAKQLGRNMVYPQLVKKRLFAK